MTVTEHIDAKTLLVYKAHVLTDGWRVHVGTFLVDCGEFGIRQVGVGALVKGDKVVKIDGTAAPTVDEAVSRAVEHAQWCVDEIIKKGLPY